MRTVSFKAWDTTFGYLALIKNCCPHLNRSQAIREGLKMLAASVERTPAKGKKPVPLVYSSKNGRKGRRMKEL